MQDELHHKEAPLFIPIISDYGFKATFGNENNTLFLRTALQALIKSEVPIRTIAFDKNTFEGITQEGRSGIFDLACIDENNNHFIVEMQYGHSRNFIQRMKFYALQKFNSMVKKGNYDYYPIPKIYCIAILVNNLLPFDKYHTVANLRNEAGELFDEQLTLITIELIKFTLEASACKSNLEKLIYIMKTLHTYTSRTQLPDFWDDNWIKTAIEELDNRKMTADERASHEIALARNAALYYDEKRALQKIASNFLSLNILSIEQIATALGVSNNFVEDVKQNGVKDY